MSRRAKRHSTPRPPVLETSYGVRRDDGGLQLLPLAGAGPGRHARNAMVAAVVLGLASLAGGLAIGYTIHSRSAGREPLQPVWVPWMFPGVVLYALAGLAFAGAVKLAVNRHRPLAIGPDGAVRHGGRVLVPAGAAASVCLDRRSRWTRTTTLDGGSSGPKYELKWAYLYVVTADGRPVELPAPYFSNLQEWELAEALAEAVAEMLRLPLTTELPPGWDPNPDSQLIRQRFAGSVLLVFATPVCIIGFALLTLHTAAAVTPAIRPPAHIEWWVGLVPVAAGGGFHGIGCRLLDWGWRRWLLLLTGQAAAGATAVLAIEWFW